MSAVDLSDQHRALLRRVVAATLPGARVALFGSRATGRARPFSDIDLLLIEPARLEWQQRAALQDALEASDLPFRADLVEADGLTVEMRARIEAEAVPL